MKKKRETLTKYDTCSLMHTALRKCCDSPITSALYNFVHLVCDRKPEKYNPWVFFGHLVAEDINAGTDKVAAVNAATMKFDTKFYDSFNFGTTVRSDDLPDGTQSVLYTFISMFRCMDKDDIAAMAAYLGDD